MGIPDEDERQVFAWTNTILGAGDPEYGGRLRAPSSTHSMAMNAYAIELGKDRLANPRDDLTTALMHAEVDGERLTTARSSARSSSCSSWPATRPPATRSATG